MVATESDRAVTGRRPAPALHGAEGGLAVVERLVEHAETLQARAPEAVLVFAEHAAAMSETADANELWVQAEGLVVRARVMLGHRAPTVGRAVAALRAAEDAEQTSVAAQLRTDLAVCARSVGVPLTGLALLRPILTVDGQSSIQRAVALAQLTGCLSSVGNNAELEQLLREGDRVVGADPNLGQDSMLLTKAMLRVGLSAHRRRQGDLLGAADAARTGIGLLDQLDDPSADGGLARVRLVLELVCALLDRGETEPAREVAESILNQPERAASIAPVSWLRLAVATRIHMVSGAPDTAVRMLRDAAYSTGRHGLHALAGRLWLELAHVEERVGDPTEAIQCLHRARVAEQLHGRMRRQAHALLINEFGSGEQAPVELSEIMTPVAPGTAPASRSENAGASSPPDHDQDHRSADSSSRVLPMWGNQEPGAGPTGPATSGRESAEQHPAEQRAVPPVSTTSVVETESWDSSGAAEAIARTQQARDSEPSAHQRSSRRARHDGEHGSIAARSVLDRLGISPGGSGGRRRAAGDDDSDEEADTEPGVEETATAGQPGPEEATASDPTPAIEQTAPGRSGDVEDRSAPAHPPESGDDTHPADDTAPSGDERTEDTPPAVPSDEFGWLPKLRLPPALAPLEGFDTDDQPSVEAASSSPASSDTPPAALAEPVDTEELGGTTEGRTPGGSGPTVEDSGETAGESGHSGQRTPSESSEEQMVPAEEPSSDAGLAELLTRALAEHRAGTSSASALVKQIGVENDEASHINGKHRNDG